MKKIRDGLKAEKNVANIWMVPLRREVLSVLVAIHQHDRPDALN